MGKFYTPIKIPDGSYKGKWSGYEINFDYEGREVNVHTDIGVRGINIPCSFEIENGKLKQKSVKADK